MRYKAYSLFIVLSIIYLLGFVNAQVESLGEVKQNNCINLIQTCSYCNSTFYSNISMMQYPDKTIELFNIAMEQHGKSFNYTWCNTIQLGQYIPTICTDVDGDEVCVSYDFIVTKTGADLTQAETNISTSTIYFLLALGIVFLILGFLITGRGFWVTWLGIFFMVLGFVILYYDLSMVNTYLNTINLTSSSAEGTFVMFARFIKLLPYITWLIVAFAIIRLVKVFKKEKTKDDGWDNNQYD